MKKGSMTNSRFAVPTDMATKAVRHSLTYIEDKTGVAIDPEIKGEVAKALSGILQRLELRGAYLSNSGFLRAVRNKANQKTGYIEKAPPVARARKKWK